MIEIKDKNGKDLNIGDTVLMHHKPMKVSSFTITRNDFIVTCTSSCIEYSDRCDEVELVEPDSWEKFESDLSQDCYGKKDLITNRGCTKECQNCRDEVASYFTDRAKKLANA